MFGGARMSVPLQNFYEQVTQLSQRDCATLCVIEYFGKSLKIIQNDTVA